MALEFNAQLHKTCTVRSTEYSVHALSMNARVEHAAPANHKQGMAQSANRQSAFGSKYAALLIDHVYIPI